MKKLLVENLSENLTIIQKMDFESVDAVLDVLNFAFHPDGIDDCEDTDHRMTALWNLFLASVGWTEDQYWDEWNSRPHKCTCCEALNDSEKILDKDPKKDLN